MNAKKILSVVTAFVLAFGLSTVAIAGPAAATNGGTKDPSASVATPTPQCIPTSSVSYTYDPGTNSGQIVVPNIAGSTGVLCHSFYVTATSWKFVRNSKWSQVLDHANPIGPISTPKTYDFGAKVTCGQGDIYASFDSSPTPSEYLDGSSKPFPEHFLHEMGFTGPTGPTYVVENSDCTRVAPKVGYEVGACYPNGDFSSKNLTLVFDNSGSTVPITFTAPDAVDVNGTGTKPIVRTVAGGAIVKVETTPIWNKGGSYTVTFGLHTVTIPNSSIVVPAFEGCLNATPGDPSHTDETCTSRDNKVLGSITVGLETGLVYSIDGPGTAYDVSPVTQATTTGLPAGDYVVSVVAAPGYVLTGASSWPLKITIKSANCSDFPTHPLVTPTASYTNLACFASGTLNCPRFDAVSFRVWKDNVDHAEEDSRGDEAACDALGARSFG